MLSLPTKKITIFILNVVLFTWHFRKKSSNIPKCHSCVPAPSQEGGENPVFSISSGYLPSQSLPLQRQGYDGISNLLRVCQLK